MIGGGHLGLLYILVLYCGVRCRDYDCVLHREVAE